MVDKNYYSRLGDKMTSYLFSPIKLREVEIKNRIALSPMLTYSARNGYVNHRHLIHYGRYANSGVGLVFVEATKIDPRGCSTVRDLGIWKDAFVQPLRQLVSVVHAEGAKIGIQLGHSGRKARQNLPWIDRGPLPEGTPGVDHGEWWELLGPSPVRHGDAWSVPKEMSISDIEQLKSNYRRAAERADMAGFDVIEVHAAHGYLLHQFLSNSANMRKDKYGGDFSNRCRLLCEVADAIREAWPPGKPLFFRISAVDGAGWTIDDSVRLAELLKARGVDVVDCSSGGIGGRVDSMFDGALEYGYQVQYADRVRHGAGVKTMAVGLIIHADQAENLVRSGRTDIVALGRELLYNPNWAVDAAIKLGVKKAYDILPKRYGWWLESRDRRGFNGVPSTWGKGTQQAKSNCLE